MKKFIVLAAALLLGFQAKAQLIAEGGFNLGFENSKVYNSVDKSYYSHPSNLFGLYAGVNYYYSLDSVADGLAVVPGLNLSFLVGRHWDYYTSASKVREVALNLPIQVSYTYQINDDVKVFGETGPTFQLALVHKVKDTMGTTYSLLNRNNKYGEYRQPFNFYWGLAAGAEINDSFRVELGFDLGFVNLSRTDNLKINRNILHLGVGYLF